MHSPTSTLAIIGSLALSGALFLAGCGGSSTATAPSAAATLAVASPAASTFAIAPSAAEPAVAASGGPGAGTEWNPPRPSGLEDDFWASVAADPAAEVDTQEKLAKKCQSLTPATPSDIDMFVEAAPESNAQEWTAYTEYFYAYATQLCANAPEPVALVYEAAGACDPEAYAYCITPDMDGQTIEIQAPDAAAFIDIAGVSVACDGTGGAFTMAVPGPDEVFNFALVYAMEMQGVAGDAVCTVTGKADGATVMTLNVTVLDPA